MLRTTPNPLDSVTTLEVLTVAFRRDVGEARVLQEALQILLATYFELHEYSLPHLLPPGRFGAILICEDQGVTDALMRECRTEWDMSVNMEATQESGCLLHSRCPFTLWQEVRECMAMMERFQFQAKPKVLMMLESWQPAMQSSANLESIFSDLQSAVKRSGRSDCGSLSNLMAVAIRGLQNRLAESEECARPLTLESCDWEGREVAALKAKIWSPTSAPPCNPKQVK